MKKLVLFIGLLFLFFSVVASAQIVRLPPGVVHEDAHSGSDSASFYQEYFFDIPEDVDSDTLQVWICSGSVLTRVDLDITCGYAMRLTPMKKKKYTRAVFKMTDDSLKIKDAHAVESYLATAYGWTTQAADTIANVGGTIIMPTAFRVAIMAGSGNGSDCDYYLYVTGRKNYPETK